MKDQLEIIINIADQFAKVAHEFGNSLNLPSEGIVFNGVTSTTWEMIIGGIKISKIWDDHEMSMKDHYKLLDDTFREAFIREYGQKLAHFKSLIPELLERRKEQEIEQLQSKLHELTGVAA